MNQIGLVEGIGIVVVLLYMVWLVAFFQFVRPRLMAWFGEALDVSVRESMGALDAGTYGVTENAPLAKHGAVGALDVITLMVGTVGVCALISIPGFLIAESGLPYRWESILLSRGVRIAGAQIAPLRGGEDAAATIAVQNESNAAIGNCQVRVADYTARNGYLTGSSAFFEIEPRENRQIEMRLSAIDPAPGNYEIALSLECDNRLKDKVRTTLAVLD